MKYKILLMIITAIVLLLAVYIYQNSPDQKLKHLCNSYKDYPRDIYYFDSETEYRSFALSRMINRYVFFEKHNGNYSLDFVLANKRGNCDDSSNLFLKCCEQLSLSCTSETFFFEEVNEFGNYTSHHTINILSVGNKNRVIDSTKNDYLAYLIYEGKVTY